MNNYNYIVIEGTIGAGKTSLSKMMAEQMNARLILEQFEENSFLPKFYKDPEKYAFPLELSFLAERYQQLKQDVSHLDLFHQLTISDYFIQKSLIFARNTLPADELTLFSKLFNIIITQLPPPDLLVYLYMDVDRLLNNIRKRGRSYEQEIPASYLEGIQNGYLEYIRQQKGLRILLLDTNDIDFVASSIDYERLTGIITQPWDIGVHTVKV